VGADIVGASICQVRPSHEQAARAALMVGKRPLIRANNEHVLAGGQGSAAFEQSTALPFSTCEPDVPRLAAVAGWHGTQTTAAAFCRGALSQSTEVSMYSKLLAIASAGVLLMAGTAAWAQSSTVEKTPGHIMQQRTPQAKSTGPGASEYAPGHLKRKSKSQSASQVTPSHRTTPTTTGIRTR
jgi:hypothetical protein